MKPQTELDRNGYLLLEAARASLAGISANYQQLNALNVFPVPDGDTGTNMMLTLRSICQDMEKSATADVPSAAEKMSRAALLGARGNSGLIMSQFFRGLHVALEEAQEIDAANFAAGLSHAAEIAYGAVPQPREGTMLTVLRESAEAAVQSAEQDDATLEGTVAAAARQAMETVERTPEMLEVLKEAGVVDSGGFGFAIMLLGIEQRLKGEGIGDIVVQAPAVDGRAAATRTPSVAAEFVDTVEEEAWGYCTVFAIEGEKIDPIALREQMESIGRSPVVAGDNQLVKVHVHMEDPGQALTAGLAYGSLSNIDIHNMDEQAARWAEDRRSDDSALIPMPEAAEPVEVAVLAVAAGDGLSSYFQELGMGACYIAQGGDSMNPSVSDLLEGINSAQSENIIVLPNNKNIVGAAQQAAQISDKNVTVIPTVSMQAGVAAMHAFDAEGTLNGNVDDMTEMMEELHVGSVFTASRDATFGGVEVREGEFMVTVDGDAVAASGYSDEMLIKGIQSIIHHGASVFVYVGQGIPADAVKRSEAELDEALTQFRRVDVQFINGGQPHYPFLFSVE